MDQVRVTGQDTAPWWLRSAVVTGPHGAQEVRLAGAAVAELEPGTPMAWHGLERDWRSQGMWDWGCRARGERGCSSPLRLGRALRGVSSNTCVNSVLWAELTQLRTSRCQYHPWIFCTCFCLRCFLPLKRVTQYL